MAIGPGPAKALTPPGLRPPINLPENASYLSTPPAPSPSLYVEQEALLETAASSHPLAVPGIEESIPSSTQVTQPRPKRSLAERLALSKKKNTRSSTLSTQATIPLSAVLTGSGEPDRRATPELPLRPQTLKQMAQHYGIQPATTTLSSTPKQGNTVGQLSARPDLIAHAARVEAEIR